MLGLGLGLRSVMCYGQGNFGITVFIRVSLKLGLGLYIRLGLWLGLGSTLPKISTPTINRNPQN